MGISFLSEYNYTISILIALNRKLKNKRKTWIIQIKLVFLLMKNYIVETYSTAQSLEAALNEMNGKYFPLEIFNNNKQFTVVYCRRDIMYVKQMKDIKY